MFVLIHFLNWECFKALCELLHIIEVEVWSLFIHKYIAVKKLNCVFTYIMNISLRYGTIFFTLYKFARAYLSKFASEIMWFLNPTWVKTREFFFSANKRKGFFVGHFAPSFIMIMPPVAIHLTLTKVFFFSKRNWSDLSH